MKNYKKNIFYHTKKIYKFSIISFILHDFLGMGPSPAPALLLLPPAKPPSGACPPCVSGGGIHHQGEAGDRLA